MISEAVINNEVDFIKANRKITNLAYTYYASGNVQTKTVTVKNITDAETEIWVKNYTWEATGLCTNETGYAKQ